MQFASVKPTVNVVSAMTVERAKAIFKVFEVFIFFFTNNAILMMS